MMKGYTTYAPRPLQCDETHELWCEARVEKKMYV